MADIKLDSTGDLILIKLSNQNNIVRDVAEERDLVDLLLKRALLSPKGHIAITELVNGELFIKDSNYGNRIYEELSEGLTINFLSRVRNHIIDAIKSSNLSTSVESVNVNVKDTNTIQISVLYTNGNNNIIELAV